MKRTLLTLSLGVLLVGFGYSQKTSAGTFMAGGNIGASFNTQKFDDGTATTTVGKQTTIAFNPSVGYFIMDGLVVGAGINLSSSTTKFDGSIRKDVFTTTSFSPFGRYYLDMGVFGHAQVQLGSATDKDTRDVGGTTVTTTNNYGLFGFEVGGGYAYFLNDNVAIEPLLVYASNSFKDKTAAPNTKDISGGIQLRIGISVFL